MMQGAASHLAQTKTKRLAGPFAPLQSCLGREGRIMHELSLIEGMRDILESAADRNGSARILRVRIEAGAFSAVEPDALTFAWEVVMRGSKAEGAVLELIVLPGRAFCYDCLQTVQIDQRLDPCPLCGGGKLMPEAGDALRIKNMEVA